MPIYEYLCKSCHNHFESLVLRKNEQVQCPGCESTNLQKMVSAHAVGNSQQQTEACPASGCSQGPCPLSCQ